MQQYLSLSFLLQSLLSALKHTHTHTHTMHKTTRNYRALTVAGIDANKERRERERGEPRQKEKWVVLLFGFLKDNIAI